ncbi:MAG: diacylglycerol/lipid kinase family protein, partial [Actinomycetota bacterium]
PAARPLQLQPSPKGQGVFVAVNPSSGPMLSKDPTQQVISVLPRAEVRSLDEGVDLQQLLIDASAEAIALGVAGGDGSVRSGAEVAVKTEKPFLLVPAGTLNHLARDLGLQSASDALAAVRKGRAAAIDAATLDGKLFFNTASIGGYVDLVETRDRLESRIGKWPAGAVALTKVLRRCSPIDLEIDGRKVRVWMVFIGNCRYEPAGLAPGRRPRLDDGMLDVRLFHARGPWGKLRLLVAALRGTLAADSLYEGYLTRELTIKSPGGPMKVACDGETFDVAEHFGIAKLPAALKIYAPIDTPKERLTPPGPPDLTNPS